MAVVDGEPAVSCLVVLRGYCNHPTAARAVAYPYAVEVTENDK